MNKKPKTFNLSKSVYKAIEDKAKADNRSASDWLNIYLCKQFKINSKTESKKLTINKVEFDFKNELLLLGVDPEILNDWLTVRKNKKASNTKTALKGLITEITKSGLMVNDAIEFAASKSWSGFKAQWYFNEQPTIQAKQYSDTTAQNIKNLEGGW